MEDLDGGFNTSIYTKVGNNIYAGSCNSYESLKIITVVAVFTCHGYKIKKDQLSKNIKIPILLNENLI